MRVVLRLMVVVMLLTVFSPKFGWESAGAVVNHAHAAEAMPADEAQAAAHGDCHEHAAVTSEVADAGDHHCCPGHVLGHLLGGVGGNLELPALDAGALMPRGLDIRFSSRTPDGLERPPRTAA